MSFEIQDLPDLIRIMTLIRFGNRQSLDKQETNNWVIRFCTPTACIEDIDFDTTMTEMTSEGLIIQDSKRITLTEQGSKLCKKWQYFFGKQEPIMEIIAGLTDGSITGLVVILTAFFSRISMGTTTFAALLTLAAVAITNFSSFFLGGITQDISDLMNLHDLIHYSVNDLPDIAQRDKSMMLIKELFAILNKRIKYMNILSAIVCSVTTYIAGFIPIVIFFELTSPLNIILSLSFVAIIAGVFLVSYRARRSAVNWKITFFETGIIILISVIASLFISGII